MRLGLGRVGIPGPGEADGVRDLTFIAFIVIIIMSSLLLGTRTMFIFTAFSLLTGFGLAYLEISRGPQLGWTHPKILHGIWPSFLSCWNLSSIDQQSEQRIDPGPHISTRISIQQHRVTSPAKRLGKARCKTYRRTGCSQPGNTTIAPPNLMRLRR